MEWQHVVPGVIVLLIKLTGTSLFLIFFPQIFPKQSITFIPMEDYSVSEVYPTNNNVLFTTETFSDKVPVKLPRWERFRRNDYWFSEDKDIWLVSRSSCKDWKSDLVVINDTKELEFINNRTSTADYFIGLTYSESKNMWMWTDGQELNINLFPMNPNPVEECATLRAGTVSAVSCYQEKQWICKKTYS